MNAGRAVVRSVDVVVRRMTKADLPDVRISARAAFQDLHERLGTPEPPEQDSQRPDSGSAIVRQLLDLDAAGAWIATVDDNVCGAAMAGLRDGLWYLAQLHVMPGYQGRGIGSRLLDAALSYGGNVRGRLLHSSLDPAAMRCYQQAGFALEPAMQATGLVRRAALPATGHVHLGGVGDLDFVADVDRGQRGAAHGPDLEVLLRSGAQLLIFNYGRKRGYAVVDGEPKIVAATDGATAAALLWAALGEGADQAVAVQILRADQQWAIDVIHRAGLYLQPTGPLCREGDTGPLAPYLPHSGIL
jgi:ribosomal protein S18 acetylase RimI-like enzyme